MDRDAAAGDNPRLATDRELALWETVEEEEDYLNDLSFAYVHDMEEEMERESAYNSPPDQQRYFERFPERLPRARSPSPMRPPPIPRDNEDLLWRTDPESGWYPPNQWPPPPPPALPLPLVPQPPAAAAPPAAAPPAAVDLLVGGDTQPYDHARMDIAQSDAQEYPVLPVQLLSSPPPPVFTPADLERSRVPSGAPRPAHWRRRHPYHPWLDSRTARHALALLCADDDEGDAEYLDLVHESRAEKMREDAREARW